MSSLALRRGETIRIRSERWIVTRQISYAEAAVVDVRGCDGGNRGVRARFLLPFEPFERLPHSDAMRVVTPRRWRHLARQVLATGTPVWEGLRTLPVARLEILPFQLEPALAIAGGLGARLLIADDVGLGKTIQAGVILAEALERDPRARALVLTPASLRDQWADELQTRFGLSAASLDATAVAAWGRGASAGANPWAAQPLIIASIDYVKRPEVLRALEDLLWDVLVVDEAHGLTGRSDRHAAARALGERARTVVLLTATPHSGNDDAFARLCAIGDLDSSGLGTGGSGLGTGGSGLGTRGSGLGTGAGFPLVVFHRTRADAHLPSERRTTWLAIAPTEAERAMHAALLAYARLVWRQGGEAAAAARLAMIVLSRRACSSAASLARSIERRLLLLPDEGDRILQPELPLAMAEGDELPDSALAAPGLPDPGDERRMLEDVLALARVAQSSESKLRAIRTLLRRSREPAIVFTAYRDTLAQLEQALGGFATVQLHGGLLAADRREALRRFASGEAAVLLATDAASEGLNLQRGCRLVVNLEVPWTPVTLEQRVGRVDRIGQPKRVHHVQLVAAQTSEQTTVAPLVRARMARAGLALGAMRVAGHALDEREVAAHVLGRNRSGGPSGPQEAALQSQDLPPGVVVLDLREAAAAEAARAQAARALISHSPPLAGRKGPPYDPEPAGHKGPPYVGNALGRPFAAALHPRGSRGYWAFRLQLTDRDDELVWETILGVAYRIERSRFGRSGDILAHTADVRRFLQRPVQQQHEALRAMLVDALRTPLALASAREQAIAAAVKRRHARLASGLIQRGLFDRRAERDAAAQRAALQDTLRICDEHLLRIERRTQIATGAVQPLFAVIAR